MTLIVGTPHWGGVCINSDTRVTNTRNGTYQDNAQKIAHIHGGIGMVACGDRTSAVMVKETIRKYLDDFAQSNVKFPPEVDLDTVNSFLFLSSLKQLRSHPYNKIRPIYNVSSEGLIGINISDQPLKLNKEECINLIKILVEGKNLNWIYSKYIERISLCANGQIGFVELNDFHQNSLYRYKVKLFDDEQDDVYEIERISFGKIIALGSGSRFNYSSVESNVLSWVLFSNGADSILNGAFHLGLIHDYAENEVPDDEMFHFKTFGGALVAGVVTTDSTNMGGSRIITGEYGSIKTGKILSKVYEDGGKLWVTTRDGANIELEPFPNSISRGSFSF